MSATTIPLSQAHLALIERARQESETGECTKHVNVSMCLRGSELSLFALSISDWFSSEATIRSFTNGKEQ